MYCNSFPPSVADGARVLILGSMPGGESLRQQQYYAFKHNVFWRMMGELFAFSPDEPYAERLAALRDRRIALWDVLASCERDGSLDVAIRTPTPNDIAGLLRRYPAIALIVCNGATAERYLRRSFPALTVPVERLPSSSPAAAGISYEEKLKRWRQVLYRALDRD